MYKAFYGLREKPFNLTPDPRFLYLSEKHKEAFAHLLYGIRNRSGFVMVTGEIGTGKTTICRNLLNQLDEDTELAFIFNPMLSPLELIKKIVSEFGIDVKGTNALELVEELNEYLLEAAAKGKNCVLLIDEAQNLDPQVLEQIRLLSNLETETEKLLQIVLIGQPELGEKLALHELRQLNQRITARYHLKPLNEKEVLHYVAYRLHVAGGRRQVKFARGAVRAVYKISKGTPRVINALCDRALLIGFTKEVRVINASIVHRAYREIRGDAVFGKQKPKWTLRQLLLNPVTAIALLCVAAAIYLNSPSLQAQARSLAGRISEALPKSDVTTPDTALDRPEVDAAATNSTTSTALLGPKETAGAGALALQNDPTSPASVPHTGEIAPANPSVESVLAAAPKSDSDAAALALMMQAWGEESTGALPALPNDAALEAFIRSRSWSYDRLNPALEQLIALDLPAFVKVIVGGEARWATLSQATGDKLTLSAAGNTPAELDREEFQRIYAAEAIIPWKDSLPGTPVLRQGQESASVPSFKEKLHRLNRLNLENTSPVYDVETATAVARIQAETSLSVDGIAGKQVRMVLSSWLKEDGTPTLTGKTSPAMLASRPASEKPEATPPVATPDVPKTKVAEKPKPSENPKATEESKPTEKPAPTEKTKPEEAPAPVEAIAPIPDNGENASAEAKTTAAPETSTEATQSVEAPPAPITITNIGATPRSAAVDEAAVALPDVSANSPETKEPPAAADNVSLVGPQLSVSVLDDPGEQLAPSPAPEVPAPAEEAPAAPAEEATTDTPAAPPVEAAPDTSAAPPVEVAPDAAENPETETPTNGTPADGAENN